MRHAIRVAHSTEHLERVLLADDLVDTGHVLAT
jgi:hypoxanthine phosphoribosyltransferase